MSTLINSEKLLKVVREIGDNELLEPDEIVELIERQPEVCEGGYKDGYIRALRDIADYLMQKMRSTENE